METYMSPAAKKIREWRNNPVQFVRDNFLVEPDEWQKDTLNLLIKKDTARRRIAMKACTQGQVNRQF
jgi:hypothetical protein